MDVRLKRSLSSSKGPRHPTSSLEMIFMTLHQELDGHFVQIVLQLRVKPDAIRPVTDPKAWRWRHQFLFPKVRLSVARLPSLVTSLGIAVLVSGSEQRDLLR